MTLEQERDYLIELLQTKAHRLSEAELEELSFKIEDIDYCLEQLELLKNL